MAFIIKENIKSEQIIATCNYSSSAIVIMQSWSNLHDKNCICILTNNIRKSDPLKHYQIKYTTKRCFSGSFCVYEGNRRIYGDIGKKNIITSKPKRHIETARPFEITGYLYLANASEKQVISESGISAPSGAVSVYKDATLLDFSNLKDTDIVDAEKIEVRHLAMFRVTYPHTTTATPVSCSVFPNVQQYEFKARHIPPRYIKFIEEFDAIIKH